MALLRWYYGSITLELRRYYGRITWCVITCWISLHMLGSIKFSEILRELREDYVKITLKLPKVYVLTDGGRRR